MPTRHGKLNLVNLAEKKTLHFVTAGECALSEGNPDLQTLFLAPQCFVPE